MQAGYYRTSKVGVDSMIDEKLFELLTTGSCGELFGDRIYPEELPRATNFEEGSEEFPAGFYTMSGYSTKDNVDFVQTLWSLTVVANSNKERAKLKASVKETLHRYKGGRIWFIAVTGMTDMKDEENHENHGK